ncbi:sigma factor-like helix-turn-helix DNA-binding protein [Campylobacter gastrosuis]|uniref:RNA polymerase sigma-70 domain-containing protein n=1 Tax=Campylobacter gastrosuis TaxID=2974576 RepID=A0ABT7HRB6_9BACT|nr:sigma factor-like helix-turn-helix DNA-binding protein [Campylobacter gastrosuis]MDL0089267.1 hypothetical protein [Campylobacter gastrosuis]
MMTQSEVARVLGLSLGRVAQIERQALAKLSHPKNKKKWELIKEIMAELYAESAKTQIKGVISDDLWS